MCDSVSADLDSERIGDGEFGPWILWRPAAQKKGRQALERMGARVSAGLRELADNRAEKVALTRFFRNKRVTVDEIVQTAAERTGAAAAGRHVLLIEDKSGRRKWVLRFEMNGVRRDMGLGPYPAVSLADARIAAADARKLIAKEVDPLEARAAARKAAKPIPTFRDIARIVIAEAKSKSTNAKVRYQWERHLRETHSEHSSQPLQRTRQAG
jgi:hypothetical protein